MLGNIDLSKVDPQLRKEFEYWVYNTEWYKEKTGAIKPGIIRTAPQQEQFVQDFYRMLYRFYVVPAGRRSGKTFRAKRNLIREAFRVPGLYFAAAPTHGQAKSIFWKDLLRYTAQFIDWRIPNPILISELSIRLINGSEIRVIGLDKPARFEGQPWTGGIIDELDNTKEDAWSTNIYPALDTLGLDTWCMLIGVPDGLKILYDLKNNFADNPDFPLWNCYTWMSSEILSSEAIIAAKATLSKKHFLQEYCASFETATGRVYEDYGKENHTDKVFNPHLPIIWTHDFNYTPMSSAICQIEENKDRNKDIINVVDEIVLTSAVAKNAALEFIEKYSPYKRLPIYIHGDASGIKGEKHGHESDYIILEKTLKNAGFNNVKRMAPRSNGPIKDGQNSLRGMICNADDVRRLFINPSKAKMCNKSLLQTQLKKGSTFQEEEAPHQHMGTALRYFTNRVYAIKQGKLTVKTF